jgi:hypothetical protein
MLLVCDGPYITAFTGSVMRQNAQRFGIAALPISLPSKAWPVVLATLRNRTQGAAVVSFMKSAREVARYFSGQP